MINPPISVPVKYLEGKEETVQLRRLKLREVYVYMEKMGGLNMQEVVAYCAGKPVEWTDELEDESFGRLSKAVYDENFPRAASLAKVCAVAAGKMTPYFRWIIGADSDGRSPKPASLESTAETRSESSTAPAPG